MRFPIRLHSVLYALVSLLHIIPLHGLPHPNCRYTSSNLECTSTNLDIPVNFDVTMVPNVPLLRLSCPNYAAKLYCNTLREDSPPLPGRPALVTVELNGFQSAGSGQPGFRRFLHSLAPQITELRIGYSRVGTVDAHLLRGFAALRTLSLANNDIPAIAPGTFQALRFPLAPAVHTSVSTRLRDLYLQGNALRQIDLSVFKPIAQSLEILELSGQNPSLNSIIQSHPGFQLALTTFSVRSNSLTNVSRDVLQSITPRPSSSYVNFDWQSNGFCTMKTDCSCCELEDFFRWASSIRKPGGSFGLQFTCSGKSFSQSSTLALNLFSSCPLTSVNSDKTVCYEAPPIAITCIGNGELATSEPDLAKSDASALSFSAINGFRCRSILYDIHLKLLQMAAHSNSTQSQHGTITGICVEGQLTVDVGDANVASVTQLTLDTDSSAECQEKFQQFVAWIYTKKFPQKPNQNVTSSSTQIVPLNRWTEEFLICSKVPPLIVRCNGTATVSTFNDTTSSDATELVFQSDNSFRCRQIAINIHRHILSQRNTVVESGAPEAWKRDAVIAVCQKGQVVLSDGNPEQAVFANFRYYSAPNQLCRDAFQRIMRYLQSALE
ncbi:uncharacterized protein LOC129588871 isoform X2 [Paramacrobiotus metropolitanus]|uniref:uncharacterized protein LOC129588871 isoform X2 n=1 Tax=Paramacrobiotus metropolitanus TaxID=2943436 RepID=UPI0024461E31|nr:uncharacterized protein LOC129588871 isoform X2 [Paramacrobiotus metropolitanus]